MGVTVVCTEQEARGLARALNSESRAKPVVVVTTPAQRATPYVDVQTVADQVGDLAEVYLIRTGPQSWAFSNAMPALTQVYGGAGRVYPVGTAWVHDPYKSPLRFAWGEHDGAAAGAQLVADALRMAADAGLLGRTSAPQVRVPGRVQQLVLPSRALVKTDDHHFASVWQELLRPDVAIDRLLEPGMRVEGLLDLESRRYDVRAMAVPVDEALAGYAPGRVVLAEVVEVADDSATLRLHPEAVVTVDRDDVTSNDLDLVSSLMTPGEVLAVRVLDAAPAWRVSLLDVDDDEEPAPAPSLLRGGPPWLLPVPPEPPPVDLADEPPAFVLPDTDLDDLELVSPPGVRGAPPPAAAPTRPTPHLLDPTRRAAASAQADEALTRQLERAVSARKRAEEQVAGLHRSLVDLRNERQLLHNELQRTKSVVRRLDAELKESRAGLRKARQRAQRAGQAGKQRGALFLQAEEQLRHDVQVAWAERIPAADKAHHPLAPYALGEEFLRTLDNLPGVDRRKVVDVIVDVLTGVADSLPGRALHRLRAHGSGDAPPVVRADGSTCWRVALQVNTPQARRMHFWRLRDGTVELSRVCRHDDMTP